MAYLKLTPRDVDALLRIQALIHRLERATSNLLELEEAAIGRSVRVVGRLLAMVLTLVLGLLRPLLLVSVDLFDFRDHVEFDPTFVGFLWYV